MLKLLLSLLLVLEVRLSVIELVAEAIRAVSSDIFLPRFSALLLELGVELVVRQDRKLDQECGKVVYERADPHAVVMVLGHHVLGEDLEALLVEHLKDLLVRWLPLLALAAGKHARLRRLSPLDHEADEAQRLQVSLQELRDALNLFLALKLLFGCLSDLLGRLVALKPSHLSDAVDEYFLAVKVLDAALPLLLPQRLAKRVGPELQWYQSGHSLSNLV